MRRCIDPRCRLVWLDPQPIEEDIGRAYAEYYTHAAAASGASLPRKVFRKVRASVLRARLGYSEATTGAGSRFLALLGSLYPGGSDALAASAMFVKAPDASSSLLDVGCGAGDFMATMRDLGWRVSGVETDPQAVERAVQRGLDVRHSGLEDAGFAGASFEALTMAHVIEHVHDPLQLLAECRRILKPRGVLVLLTPNSDSWGHRRFGRDWRGLEPPRHMRVHNRRNLLRLLKSADLVPVRVATLAINANAIWRTSAAIRKARSNRSARVAPPRSLAAGVPAQVAERARLKVDADAGEDLLAIATRV